MIAIWEPPPHPTARSRQPEQRDAAEVSSPFPHQPYQGHKPGQERLLLLPIIQNSGYVRHCAQYPATAAQAWGSWFPLRPEALQGCRQRLGANHR